MDRFLLGNLNVTICFVFLFFNAKFWWFDAVVTPDNIPNSEVKHCSSDDTLLEGKVASRQN